MTNNSAAAVKAAYPLVELTEPHLLAYEEQYFSVHEVDRIRGIVRQAEPNIQSAVDALWFVKSPVVADLSFFEKRVLHDTINVAYQSMVVYDPNG